MKHYLYNMLSNIKNGLISKKKYVLTRKVNVCLKLLYLLWKEGFISGYTNSSNKQYIKIQLKYVNGKPAITSIKLFKKPGNHITLTKDQLWKVKQLSNLIIISNNKGFVSLKHCKDNKIGGYLFASIK